MTNTWVLRATLRLHRARALRVRKLTSDALQIQYYPGYRAEDLRDKTH
jgi:hypothetical protein